MVFIQLLTTLLLATVLLTGVLLVYSFIRTAGGTRYSLIFHEPDRFDRPGQFVKRRYRGLSHFFCRLMDTGRYAYPLLRLFAFHTLSPAFREKIFITTAISNNCPQ